MTPLTRCFSEAFVIGRHHTFFSFQSTDGFGILIAKSGHDLPVIEPRAKLITPASGFVCGATKFSFTTLGDKCPKLGSDYDGMEYITLLLINSESCYIKKILLLSIPLY